MAGPTIKNKAILDAYTRNTPPGMGTRGRELCQSLLISLRVLDEQDHVRRGRWINTPPGVSGDIIERIMYYRGNGAMFYIEAEEKFYFLPFVGQRLDVYGRYRAITPLPFTGTASDTEGKKVKPFLDGLELTPVYDIVLPEELTLEHMTAKCVILTDYTQQMSPRVQPRYILNEPLLQIMSECIPLARTVLFNNSGIDGIRVDDENDAASVIQASSAVSQAALNGDRWVPLQGKIDFQELTGKGAGAVQDYLLALQSLDNFRLSLHGLGHGGIFQKSSHMLEAEQIANSGVASLVMQDAVSVRQHFCNIVNSIWPLGLWYEPSETVTAIDRDLDGDLYDDETTETQSETISESEVFEE